MTTLRDAQGRVQRLESQLASARAELADLQQRRDAYQETVQPVIASARETVSESIVSLQGWRQRFNDAVQSFATDEVGALGRDLVQIERKLFSALHRVVSVAHNAKMRELDIPVTTDNGIERVQHCEPAAKRALVQAGGDDPRLEPFSDVTSETGQRFLMMIREYLADQKVRVYHPRSGLRQFRRK